jgi:hypothetical protein
MPKSNTAAPEVPELTTVAEVPGAVVVVVPTAIVAAAPVAPVAPVARVAPVSPRGIVKFNIAGPDVPPFVMIAEETAAQNQALGNCRSRDD